MAQVNLQDDPYAPSTQPNSAPIRLDEGLAAAKAAYGNSWDPDAQQQYDYRVQHGQSPEDILKHTQEDYQARFHGAREQQNGGGSGGGGIGSLYNDPASAQLQSIAQAQMGEVRHSDSRRSIGICVMRDIAGSAITRTCASGVA